MDETRCGLAELQTVMLQHTMAADPDERRARRPHSLIEDGVGLLRQLIRHSPRRSYLASSLQAVKRR